MCKTIYTAKGEPILVDDEDYPHLMQWKWHIRRGGDKGKGKVHPPYAVRTVKNEKGVSVKRAMVNDILHMDIPKGMTVDHENHNTLDNRKSNLRLATLSQNSQNKTAHGKTSKYLGVSKAKDKWKVSISHSFYLEEKAAHCYDAMVLKFFGDDAELNFPVGNHKQYIPSKGKASKYKGVSINKKGSKRWKMTFTFLVEIEEEAARAYDEAASFLFHEFANPNFPEEI